MWAKSCLSKAGRVGVTVIYPGAVATDLAMSIPDETYRGELDSVLQRGLAPEAVAEAVFYAVSQPSSVCVSEIVIRPSAMP